MMARLGIELGARTLRGVRLEGWYRTRARTVEIEWDREHPAEAVAALRQHLGPAPRIALALDLPLLFTKQVKLPALEPAAKRSILRLEPERFFAVRAEDIVPAVRGEDDLVFAAREGPLAEWVAALEQLGPVDVVEPGPVALARALGRASVTTAVTLLDAERDGIGVVEMCEGRVVRARRVFGGLDAVASALRDNGGTPATLYLSPWSEDRGRALGVLLPDATLRALPAVADVDGAFLPAYGAALATGAARDFARTLVPPELATRITTRRRRALALASAAGCRNPETYISCPRPIVSRRATRPMRALRSLSDTLRRLKPRERRVILGGASVSAAALVIVLGVLPFGRRWAAREDAYAASREQWVRLETLAASTDGLRRTLAEQQRAFAADEARLVSGATPALAASS